MKKKNYISIGDVDFKYLEYLYRRSNIIGSNEEYSKYMLNCFLRKFNYDI